MQPVPVLPIIDQSLLEGLPPILRAIVRALGIRRAREWLMDYGGRNVCIPLSRASQGLSVEEVVRLRHTLINHMDADSRVTLPKVDKILNHYRDQQIRKDRANTSLSMLARRYGLTVRHIQNIVRGQESEASYQTVFPDF